MKIFLSYSSSEHDINNQKEQIDKFIEELLSLGFPETNLEYKSYGNFSGVELETDGTVLFLKESRSLLKHQELCYGDVVLVSASTETEYCYNDQWKGVTVSEDAFSSLPSSIVLSAEQASEEKSVIDTLISQELNNVAIDSVHDDGRPYYDEETITAHFKPLVENSWGEKRYEGNALKSKVDRTLHKATEQYKHRKHDDHLLLLKNQLSALMSQVCEMGGHSREDGDKYSLLLDLREKIDKTAFTAISDGTHSDDDKNFACAAKNFIVLALQRNKLGYSDRTKSGEKIKELLNNPEYQQLRQYLFGKSHADSPIHYLDLLKFSGYSPEDSKAKFFSSSNKQKTYDLYLSKRAEDKFLSQGEIIRFTS